MKHYSPFPNSLCTSPRSVCFSRCSNSLAASTVCVSCLSTVHLPDSNSNSPDASLTSLKSLKQQFTIIQILINQAAFYQQNANNTQTTRMWANAQRYGRPAKCRWRPLFNTANFGWRALLECCAVTLPRCKTRCNLLGSPKLTNRSQWLVGRSSLSYEDMLFNKFLPIVDMWLSCEDTARQSCAMVPRWRIFGNFMGPAFPASRVQHISHMHSKFTLRPHHVWKYGRHPISDRWD